jgi:lysine 2,3-aminomutase
VVSQSPGKIVLRNYEGFITTYYEPEGYDRAAREELWLEGTLAERAEGAQKGVADLHSGHRLTIKPEGFDDLHTRGREGEITKRGKRNKMDSYDELASDPNPNR